MSREEKERILKMFDGFPDAVKTAFAAGKAFGDLEAQTAADTHETDDQPEA